MARRSDHSREELADLILESARLIVEAEGFAALTARAVADAIGYSPGTLYNHFANLDDLVIHLNARTLDDLHDELASVRISGNPQNDLIDFAGIYIRFMDEHSNLWNVLFEHRLPDGTPLPDWYTAKIAGLLGLVENALSPLFPDNETEARAKAARVLWAGLHGICSLATGGKLQAVTGRTANSLAEFLVVNYVAGLRSSAKCLNK